MRSRNDIDVLLFISMMAISVIVVGVAMFFADRMFTASLEAKEIARTQSRAEELAADGILYVVHTDPLPALDPFSPEWDVWPALPLAVTPQIIAMPVLENPVIDQVRVQAVTDGTTILWRLSWLDATPDMNVDAARFTDAAAVQFPLHAEASYMMGDTGRSVQILHWKGVWQKDVDDHFQDVQDLHPNYWTDLYWFADGDFPYPVPSAFADTLSHVWFPAYRAGNPLADFHRREPVEELIAEGYGSLTPQKDSVTRGRGRWRNGRWGVVFARPLRSEDPLDYQFVPGGRGTVSVAVWEGSSGNVGGRKHWSLWFEFVVQAFGVVS
jgi:hypothetical protein